MQNVDLIMTLTSGLTAALALGYATHRLGLSPIVGYLLAGIAVGPHTPGFAADRHLAEQLAEIGVVLLMFGVGLHFHLNDLLAVRHVAVPGAVVQSFFATVAGALLGRSFGWDWTAGIVFGLAISVASTVVLMRVLADNRDLHTPAGHIAVGWLIVEDLFTVMVLVGLPALVGAGGWGRVMLALAVAAGKIIALMAIALIVGGRIIPFLLDRIARTRSRELFTLTVLVVALGIAVGSTKLFDVSMPLGAFLAGLVVGRSEFSQRAASEALPMRDAFAVLFFVSVGMLLDPRHLLQSPGLVAATLAVIMVGKPLAALVIVRLLGYPPRVSFSVAAALAQIGEFSFILATLAKEMGVLTEAGINTLVVAAIVSITFNPLLYRLVDPLESWVVRQPRLRNWLGAHVHEQPATATAATSDDSFRPARHRAVVVGYGPVGQTVTRLLRENELEPTVIELNLETVRRLRDQGVAAIYGDATHREILKSAGIGTAGSLILSTAGMHGAEQAIRQARELNPDIRILARSTYVRELPAIRRAGAETVFSGEGEIALAMTEAILRGLGATPDQIDRERDRIRSDLLGRSPSDETKATPLKESEALATSGPSETGPSETPRTGW